MIGALGQQSHALTSEGHDASEDGTGRGTSVVVSTLQAHKTGGYRVDAEGAAGGHLIVAPPTKGSTASPGVNAPGRRQEDDVNLALGGGLLVRRLTPIECERLMSWPDDWTAIDGEATPDSRRYAACGDGVVSNVAEWIGRGILREDAA